MFCAYEHWCLYIISCVSSHGRHCYTVLHTLAVCYSIAMQILCYDMFVPKGTSALYIVWLLLHACTWVYCPYVVYHWMLCAHGLLLLLCTVYYYMQLVAVDTAPIYCCYVLPHTLCQCVLLYIICSVTFVPVCIVTSYCIMHTVCCYFILRAGYCCTHCATCYGDYCYPLLLL